MMTKIVNHWKVFEEPSLDENGHLVDQRRREPKIQIPTQRKEQSDSEENQEEIEVDLRLEMELPEGCLKVNLGIPIIVVVNKVDLLLHGDKKAFLENNFDFI